MANQQKRTLIISLDECVLKTSIFKEEFPRVDCMFNYQKLKIFVCFRNFLKEFLESLQKHFEIIAWTSSQSDYTELLVDTIQNTLDFRFDYILSVSDQT